MFLYDDPKSVCKCGHTGDGNESSHLGRLVDNGHGKCMLCPCQQFTWKKFLPAFQEFLDAKETR
jgi:hypothetical protein